MSESDRSLIVQFNANRSDEAFAALVQQHVNLVFGTAMRQIGDPHAAEEITQNVFVALAQSAGKLGSHPTIAGWLHQTALNKSREWLRAELRHRKREQVAVNLQTARAEGDSVWSSLVPLLDEALLELREADRQAVILHFLEGRNFQEVGSVLGVGEDAARKRVNRCLDQLTHFFRRQGFATPALAAGAPLFALSAHAAPAGLAASATSAGLAAHSTISTLTLIKGALKIMAWTKAKTAIVTAASVLLVSSVTTVVVVKAIHGEPSYGGKTVTAWLDQLVLYENRSVPGGTEEVLRVENTLGDPSVRALLNLGPKAVPTLTKRLLDIPEPSPAAWKISFKRRPVPTAYPEFQRARKTAAGFALVALGKNDGGGYTSFMETYARAPKINVTGPPVGVVPSTVMALAKAIFPERRQEFIDDIFKGLEHTNAACRQMSMECARRTFPDELVKHRELLVRLTQDRDEFVQQATLGALILIVQDNPAPNLMPPSEIERTAEDVLQNPQTTARTREYANTLLKLAEARAAK